MLPPESNDKSLAMTGSYSGMLLTILLINEIKAVNGLKPAVASLCQYGKHLLGSYVETIEKIACMPFNRDTYDRLREADIATQVHYVPIHHHPVSADLGLQPGELAVCDDVYDHLLSLPVFPDLDDEGVGRIVAAVKHIVDE